MANTVNVSVLLSGPRNVLLAVYLKSDGATGELVNETLFGPADLGLPPSARLTLEALTYNFAGFDAVVQFDSGGVIPTFKWVLSEGTNAPADFEPYGGLRDGSGMDGTGELQITTTGFTASTDQGSILIKLRRP